MRVSFFASNSRFKMVSFSCETCNDTLKKPKLDSHVQRCRYAVFTCLDCNVTFQGTEYRAHTSCISEDQKYQKSVYKAPKGKGKNAVPAPPAPKSLPPHLELAASASPTPSTSAAVISAAPTAAPVVAPVAAPAPVQLSASGVHPDRQRILDAAAPGPKNAGKRKYEASAGATSAPVAEKGEPVVKKSKQEKKDLKADKKAAKRAVKKEAAAAAESAAVELVAVVTVTKEALPVYLDPILTELLKVSQPLDTLFSSVISQAIGAGYGEEETRSALMGALRVGGESRKNLFRVEF